MKIKPIDVKAMGMALALAALGLVAQATHARAENPCRPDAQKLCTGVQPGGGRIVACLKQRESELTPQCQKLIAQSKQGGNGVPK